MSEKSFCKNAKEERSMTPLEESIIAADWLVQKERRGNGDTEPAMRRLESRYGIDWHVFWKLKYRPPREVGALVWVSLVSAYHAEKQRQMDLLRHDTEITRRITGPHHPAVVAAETVVGKANNGEA